MQMIHVDNILWGETLVPSPLCNPPRGISVELPDGVDIRQWLEKTYGIAVKSLQMR